MTGAAVQLALHLAAAAPAAGWTTAGQACRLPGPSPEGAPTIHDPVQLRFAFVREASR